jgi:hypothetical protein
MPGAGAGSPEGEAASSQHHHGMVHSWKNAFISLDLVNTPANLEMMAG